jgi:hypothetical protein
MSLRLTVFDMSNVFEIENVLRSRLRPEVDPSSGTIRYVTYSSTACAGLNRHTSSYLEPLKCFSRSAKVVAFN